VIFPPRLILTDALWRKTIAVLQQYTPKKKEAGCFWYGLRTDTASCALVLGIPRQINLAASFEIPADNLAALTDAACEASGLVAVAQLHIHPGGDVRHSPLDDNQVVSRNIYSLIIPHYCMPPILLDSIGIHRFENDGWTRLSPEAGRKAITVTASFVDTR
jgi:proteasome lid subunit RPN8/RPN11